MKITAKIELPKKLTAKIKELKMPLSGGYEEGYGDGYKDGYVVGEGDGYVKGETDGRESGYNEGYGKGYDEGFAEAGENSLTAEDLAFTGDISYLFYGDNWFDKVKHLVSFTNISSASYAFAKSENLVDLSSLTIPFNNAIIEYMFQGCKNLKRLPRVSGTLRDSLSTLFDNCYQVNSDEINNFFASVSFSALGKVSSSVHNMFQSCYSIRDISDSISKIGEFLNSYTGTSGSINSYSSLFNCCYSLDEISNLYVYRINATTSNRFSSTVNYCGRLKNMVFETNDGAPYVVKWKSQTIDLTTAGFANIVGYIYNYNSGITKDKEVKDDATYQSLKNSDDWFTANEAYSRYNHDSAVNTINSLPDTSAYLATAGGTNTIKFKGSAGSKTDGGAINTLTAEEIAVAAAKGWTVTFA